jgi:hypothetical protein
MWRFSQYRLAWFLIDESNPRRAPVVIQVAGLEPAARVPQNRITLHTTGDYPTGGYWLLC